jgi:hypothetical protein
MEDKSCLETIVDVGVLKEQVSTLSDISRKMDKVIEKLIDQHDRHIAKIYSDMENRRLETETDIKELHGRIDTVLDKVQDTERRLLEEIKYLRKDINDHNLKEKESLDKILQWKWMVAGGIVVLSWLISHVPSDIIAKVFK